MNNGDSVSLHGNAVAQYADSTVGVFSQLVTSTPMVNTAFLSGLSVGVSVRALLFSSPDSYTSSTSSIAIGESQASGLVTAIGSAESFSHAVNFTVVRLSTPTLQVDDNELQALPGSCVGFQSTRLQALSDGVDIARLLTFQTSASPVAQIDASVLARPVVVGVGAGTAQVYVKDISFASVAVEVKTVVVEVLSLSAGVVTGVEWSSSSSSAGPFLPTPSHEFVSESSVGWLYVSATFADGTSHSVESSVTVRLAAPLNESIAVTYPTSQPPMVNVVVGASSICGWIEAATCMGYTYALFNLTVPPPVSVTLSSGGRNTLVPETNVADEFSNHYAFADLEALVELGDGSQVAMQTDPRMTFAISSDCGSVANSGNSKRLAIASTCRSSSVTVSVVMTNGSASVASTASFNIVWLASLELRMYYQDSSTVFSSSEVKHRYACTNPSPEFHTLNVRAFGTLTSGTSASVNGGASYSASGGSLSGSGSIRTLSISSAGRVTITVSAFPNPDGVLFCILFWLQLLASEA